MRQHPRDPSAAHRAAPFLAQLVACGMIGRAEALAALLFAAAPAAVSSCGRQARLTHALDDATAIAVTRARAAKSARAALTILISVRAPRRALLAAATGAAAPPLAAPEIEALVADCIARHLRRQRHAHPARPAIIRPRKIA